MSDQATEGKLSPLLRRQRFAAVQPFLKGRVLDVGCGVGHLAEWFEPDMYFGVEIDQESLQRARELYPCYRFEAAMPRVVDKFDTVVALAVIEHVANPSIFLQQLALHLRNTVDSCIICTTPHPTFEWVHDIGAAINIFSKHANEEHETLLNRRMLSETAEEAGLRMTSYHRFLLGANQLAVFKARDGLK